MTQVFTRRGVLAVKLAACTIVVVAVGAVAVGVAHQRPALESGLPVAQPIPFSHKHHVGDVGLDCRYCHTTVETSAFAGMPSTRVCLTCHSQLFAHAGVLAALRRSEATRVPIAWNRVHRLPGYVYFDHSVHVAKGVACVECHGRVDQMPLTWRVAPLQMQWCIGCHADPAPHLHPAGEVFAPVVRTLEPQEVAALARLMQLRDRRALTDCSTCHR